MRHGGMVSRGRWDMRWWWFSLTDILIHIIHLIHTYVHTLWWGGDTPAAPTLFRFFFLTYTYICSYTYICTYKHTHIYIYIYIYIHTHIHIHTHTYVNIHIPVTMHTQVRGRYPSCTVYILPSIPGWGGDTPAAPTAHFFPNFAHSGEGEIPQLHLNMYKHTCITARGMGGFICFIYLMRREAPKIDIHIDQGY